MQQQHRVGQYGEKVNEMNEPRRKFEEEKGRGFKENREMKKVAEETYVMADEALTPNWISEAHTREQQNNIESSSSSSSKHESQKMLELQLSEKDALLENIRNEMDNLRSSEANAMALLSDYKRKIQALESELDKRRESEANLFDTLVMQTKQLEQNKILLEESKLEIGSLEGKIKALEAGGNQTMQIPGDRSQFRSIENRLSRKGSVKGKKYEAEPAEEDLNITQEGEGQSVKTKTLLEELYLLKCELKSATEAEENSKKAMDDLAFALKEVATEANHVKAKLTLSQVELEHSKGNAERWRVALESTEEKYKELLEASRKEADRYKNTTERLRMEAEESLSAWNVKEKELVNCIRRAEEERLAAQKEANKLVELLNETENKIKVSKDENQKLRDILKQALNEANVAKEAAEIAKAENARLQDSLNLLVHENEMLKIHEAASFENIKELKRMISESSMKEFKIEDIEKPSTKEGSNKEDKEPVRKGKEHGHRESRSLSKTFSINLKEMITPHKQQQQQQHKAWNEESNRETDDDTLRGSIFDEVDSSDSESRHDGDMGIPDDFDHLDDSHFDDSENDRNSRKRRALLRRFGDLIRRRNNHTHHRKESSTEEHLQT
ncbi:hypothetical protein VNO77_44056 [Canavalia gladiata]|uniref:Uncharacterized protein n=1 Tax=Canavalia gladiata TaxID=3824 RepID=A0AAN9JV82_CANGL